MKTKNKGTVILLGTLLVLILSFFINISVGSLKIPVLEVLNAIIGHSNLSESNNLILFESRVPQAITALLAGGGLAVSGLLMQTIFNNYLAGPSELGISSGASLAVSIAIISFGISSPFIISFAGIVGAGIVLLLIVYLSRKIKSNVTLLIIGLMLSFIISAVVGILEFNSSKESLHLFIMWGLGSFANLTWQEIPWFAAIITLTSLTSILLTKPLNALLLGQSYAKTLGVNIKLNRFVLLLIIGVLTGVITAFCGPIGFLGLAIPHISRALIKSTNHLLLLPSTLIIGAIFGLLCDAITRLPGNEGVLPINGITALVGAPIVIWVILKNKNFS